MFADHLIQMVSSRVLPLLLFSVMLLAPRTSLAVLVAWDPNPVSEGVEGYRIYVAADGVTNAPIDVGNIVLAPLPNLTGGRRYQIFVTAYNAAGESEPSESLYYTAPLRATLPVVWRHPEGKAVHQGEPLELVVGAEGTGPLRYDWICNGAAIASSNTNRFVIPGIQPSQAGDYAVRISNPIGVVTSLVARVEVILDPNIIEQPQSRSLLEGASAVFSAEATGTTPLSFQWQKDGSNIQGAVGRFFTIPKVQLVHRGTYRVLVTSVKGTATSLDATLDVLAAGQAQPPSFEMEPQALELFAGEFLILDSQVSGTDPILIQWHKNGASLLGKTNRVLQLESVTEESAGDYFAVARSAIGVATSAVAQVTVTMLPEVLPPTIVAQPFAFKLGNGLALQVGALSDELIFYQWMRDGVALPEEVDSMLRIEQVAPEHSGSYSVLVHNSAGATLSESAVLHVRNVPTSSAEAIDVSVPSGAAVVLMAESSSSSLRHQWYKNGAPLLGATNSIFIIENVGSAEEGNYAVASTEWSGTTISAPVAVRVVARPEITVPPADVLVGEGQEAVFEVQYSPTEASVQWRKDGMAIPGATNSFLVIPTALYSDSGTYSVRVSNAAGGAESVEARLAIAGPPRFLVHPVGGVVAEGSNFELSAQVAGFGPITYRWLRNDTELFGATNSALRLAPVSPGMEGSYRLVVKNPHGFATSSEAIVEVVPLATILEQPQSLRVRRGSDAAFSVEAASAGLVQYEWLRNGVRLPGQNGSTLQLVAVDESDAGGYQVIVRNEAGEKLSAEASLVVLEPVTVPVLPVEQHVAEGQRIHLEVGAAGSGPLRYQWLKNGAELSGAAASSLIITHAKPADGGAYAVRVSNDAGAVVTPDVVVTVAVAPRISGFGGEAIVNAGRSSFVLRPEQVTGTQPIGLQWLKNGAVIPGAVSSNLTLTNINSSAAGNYQLRASNWVGVSTSAPLALRVRVAPVIASQPKGGEVLEDRAINLAVLAAGDGPFTYQWFYNGVAIANSVTSNFFLASASAANAGAYTVRVSNDVASVHSAEAVIQIVLKPRVVAQSAGKTAQEGDKFILSVSASGTNPLEYQWFKDGAPLLGAKAPNLAFFGIHQSQAGSYRLAVENRHSQIYSDLLAVSVTANSVGGLVPRSGAVPTLTINGLPGKTYQVEISGDLSNWEVLGSISADDLGKVSVSMLNNISRDGCFIRLKSN